jgi:hypothetical protein
MFGCFYSIGRYQNYKQIERVRIIKIGIFLIDCEEMRFHMSLFCDKNVIPNDSNNLETVLVLIAGVIKGVLSAFNIECSVVPTLKPQPIINGIITGSVGQNPQQTVFSYSFNISLLNIAQS